MKCILRALDLNFSGSMKSKHFSITLKIAANIDGVHFLNPYLVYILNSSTLAVNQILFSVKKSLTSSESARIYKQSFAISHHYTIIPQNACQLEINI